MGTNFESAAARRGGVPGPQCLGMPPFDEVAVSTLTDLINAGVSSQLIYEGSVCETYPCWNDGVCIESNVTDTGYFCMCPFPFGGDHCQNKVEDSCSSLDCETGTVCVHELNHCLPFANFSHLPSCSKNPCLNKAQCVALGSTLQRCLCSSLFHGVLCELPNRLDVFNHITPTAVSWSFLQTLFLLALVILLLAGCISFCYGGNVSCYLLMPEGRRRYNKWRDIPSDDFAWDLEFDDDAGSGSDALRRLSSASNSPDPSGAKNEAFEMASRPMRVSTTSETFVSYNPATPVELEAAHRSLLPGIS